ncbi:hypothetical protein [Thalassoroseus pseudoceratinae]|uniref:hypothetical protein n=1 Tax=Thalassoroseus pseudoceratinae TaxID=2713176 RepID=UPI001423EF30|nr:hypothetical protein [Thalassoroseus pseudoceratinae]
MKMSLLSKYGQNQPSMTSWARQWGWKVGVGLILCGNSGFAQQPPSLDTVLLQPPAPMVEDADADDTKSVEKPPAKAAEPDSEPAPAPEQTLPARAEQYTNQIIKLRRLKESLIAAPRTVDRIDLQIEALTSLIQEEASDRLAIALEQSDPVVRDRQLKDLIANRFYAGTPAAEEAGNLLQKRNVDGKLYPDIAAAEAAQDKIDAQDKADQEKAEQKATAELEKLADPALAKELLPAMERIANERFESIRRLVPSQQVCKLREFINDFPETKAAAVAEQLIALRNAETERRGQDRLRRAMMAPLNYDQRWRRLKELIRDFPQTSAAMEAESLLNQHATTLPPTTLHNHSSERVRFSIETVYDGETVYRLSPGDSINVTLMFPALLRVSINEDVHPSRIFPGSSIGLSPNVSVSGSGYSTRGW